MPGPCGSWRGLVPREAVPPRLARAWTLEIVKCLAIFLGRGISWRGLICGGEDKLLSAERAAGTWRRSSCACRDGRGTNWKKESRGTKTECGKITLFRCLVSIDPRYRRRYGLLQLVRCLSFCMGFLIDGRKARGRACGARCVRCDVFVPRRFLIPHKKETQRKRDTAGPATVGPRDRGTVILFFQKLIQRNKRWERKRTRRETTNGVTQEKRDMQMKRTRAVLGRQT